MASSNVNVGIFEGRNSSRVLKPPGGGHSQIFGFEEEKPKPKIYKQNSSEINACFGQNNDVETKLLKETDNVVVVVEEEKKKKQQENEENAVPEVNIDELKKDMMTPQRKRIPPGGYSSGFW